MGLTPAFEMTTDNKNITAIIQTNLLSLIITDNAGIESDTVQVILDDTNNQIALPKVGQKIHVSLGYKETSVLKMGSYIVDEVTMTISPQTLGFTAKAADMKQSIKVKKNKSWQNSGKNPPPLLLADTVNSIASNHGLTAKIGDDFKTLSYDVLNQTNESDLHFLTRLANSMDAIVKPVDDKLLFIKKGQAKTVSNKIIAPIQILSKQIISCDVTIAQRDSYHSVQASYLDLKKAKTINVTVGDSEPAFIINEIFKDEQQAAEAARAKLDIFARGKSGLELTIVGNAKLKAGLKIELSNTRNGINGIWNIETTINTYNNEGYITDITATIDSK